MDDSAAALLTRISPAPADDASRAVVFTASPTAVKSGVPLAHATDVRDPRVDANANRYPPAPDRRYPSLAEASEPRIHCVGCVLLTREPWDEERDRLVAQANL